MRPALSPVLSQTDGRADPLALQKTRAAQTHPPGLLARGGLHRLSSPVLLTPSPVTRPRPRVSSALPAVRGAASQPGEASPGGRGSRSHVGSHRSGLRYNICCREAVAASCSCWTWGLLVGGHPHVWMHLLVTREPPLGQNHVWLPHQGEGATCSSAVASRHPEWPRRGSEEQGPQWAPCSQSHACLPPRRPLWRGLEALPGRAAVRSSAPFCLGPQPPGEVAARAPVQGGPAQSWLYPGRRLGLLVSLEYTRVLPPQARAGGPEAARPGAPHGDPLPSTLSPGPCVAGGAGSPSPTPGCWTATAVTGCT